ncbi:MAG: ABC transporter ATP-binding protein [Candidatus Sumerlaeia bacterium]
MRDLIRKLLPYVLKYKWMYVLGFLVVIVTNALYVRISVRIGRSIDYILAEDMQMAGLWKRVGIIAGMALVGFGAHYLQRIFLIVTSRKIEFEFRNDFFQHLMSLSPAYYDRMRTGDIISRATGDMDQIRMALGPGIMYPMSTLTLAPIAFFSMMRLSWPTALIALLPLMTIPFLVYFLARVMYLRSLRIQEHFSDFSGRIQEAISGIRVVKAFVQGKHELEVLDKMSRQNVNLNLSLARIQALFHPILIGILILGTILIIWAGGRYVTRDEAMLEQDIRLMTIGNMLTFIILYRQLYFPVMALGWVVSLYQRASASMHRILLIWNEKPAIVDTPEMNPELKSVKGEIEFRDLSFSYPKSGEQALKHINLKIPAGQTLGIVGPVGSGKSTLSYLVARLYEPPKGKLFIDGHEIHEYPLEVLRRAVGVVFQETYLFSDTIAENICFGRAEADKELAVRTADVASVKEDIDELPKGFDTLLGERGVNLSGGQKQRVSLARAVASNPPILVLDDAFAAVDTNTEERILGSLREVMRERTTILISHRISTVKLADHIIVLDDGAIAEEGTHEDLVELGGLYAEIHQRQLLEAAIEKEDR